MNNAMLADAGGNWAAGVFTLVCVCFVLGAIAAAYDKLTKSKPRYAVRTWRELVRLK